jgi:outer membrane protein OmpA-like peptidoglycan-associated protein/opacity protein-like surface antigen
MKKLVFASVASVVALAATPAMARDDAWYVGVEGGALVTDDLEVDADFRYFDVHGDTELGIDADVVVGHDFGMFRVEAEGGYKHFGIDELDPDIWDDWDVWDGWGDDPPTEPSAGGDINIISGMINGLIDIGGDNSIGLTAGGGVGVAKTSVKVDEGWPGWIDADGVEFAWQLLAGIRVPIGRTIDLGLKYRYFNADIDDEDMFDHDFGADIVTHSLLASLLINFGASEPAAPRIPPPPPPRAVPPPPPPKPPVVSCNRGPYIVFFDWDKADITPEAATILDSAVAAYGNCTRVPVMLAGFTDRSGSEEYNLGLASRRNNSVTGYLTSRGVPAAAISSEAFGEANPRVPTADGVRELQNRRVEIAYGPGSGR